MGQVIATVPLKADWVNHKHRSIVLFFENLSFTEKASWLSATLTHSLVATYNEILAYTLLFKPRIP